MRARAVNIFSHYNPLCCVGKRFLFLHTNKHSIFCRMPKHTAQFVVKALIFEYLRMWFHRKLICLCLVCHAFHFFLLHSLWRQHCSFIQLISSNGVSCRHQVFFLLEPFFTIRNVLKVSKVIVIAFALFVLRCICKQDSMQKVRKIFNTKQRRKKKWNDMKIIKSSQYVVVRFSSILKAVCVNIISSAKFAYNKRIDEIKQK